ncbi:MAG: hypothetical protein ACK5L3_03950 [Oscillospiraceae bacterium]
MAIKNEFLRWDNPIRYEYQEQTVTGKMLDLYIDNCAYFGWVIENKTKPLAGVNSYTLKLKRNRHIANKIELTRLKRQFDSYIKEIESMETSKILAASMAAYVVGVLGTAFMAGSVFSYVGGLIPLSILLAIPAFIGWGLPYFIYRAIEKKKENEVQPFINQKYDEIYAVCERAYSLLPH